MPALPQTHCCSGHPQELMFLCYVRFLFCELIFYSVLSLYMLCKYFNIVHLNTGTDDGEAVLRSRQ